MAAVSPEGIFERRGFGDDMAVGRFLVGRCCGDENVLLAVSGKKVDIALDRCSVECQKLTDDIEVPLGQPCIYVAVAKIANNTVHCVRYRFASLATIE